MISRLTDQPEKGTPCCNFPDRIRDQGISSQTRKLRHPVYNPARILQNPVLSLCKRNHVLQVIGNSSIHFR